MIRWKCKTNYAIENPGRVIQKLGFSCEKDVPYSSKKNLKL
ncbi:hypothetical protein [Alkalibaculum sporogenes]|nr:hypothetical protein [Alkalibaculum sporogenes]